VRDAPDRGAARGRDAAIELGVRDVPAIVVGDRVFHGDAGLPAAARAAAAATAA
jgi:protein-disulfide isomerase